MIAAAEAAPVVARHGPGAGAAGSHPAPKPSAVPVLPPARLPATPPARTPAQPPAQTPARTPAPPADDPLAALAVRADEGNVEAQLALAHALERGEGVPPDLPRARTYYCRAARTGSGEAAYRLSRIFLTGWGVPIDMLNSLAWTREAAARGHAESALVVRYMSARGPRPRPTCLPRRSMSRTLPRSFPDYPEISGLPYRDRGAPRPPPAAIVSLVKEMAPRYELDPDLVLAIVAIESGYQPNAVSPRKAQGLMQLIPDTARRFGVDDPFDPADNLRGGMSYLRWLLAYFEGDVRLTLAGYNAGEGAVDRYSGIPPYAETQAYVSRVLQSYPHPWHRYDESVTTPASRRSRTSVSR